MDLAVLAGLTWGKCHEESEFGWGSNDATEFDLNVPDSLAIWRFIRYQLSLGPSCKGR